MVSSNKSKTKLIHKNKKDKKLNHFFSFSFLAGA